MANGYSSDGFVSILASVGFKSGFSTVIIMAEKQAALLALVRQLQSQLRETPEVDPEVADQIHDIVREIEASLPITKPSSADESPLTNRVREAALDFEASHPTLSRTVGNIADTLAQMGI